MKVKDLLDLINLNSNQGVIKGLPSNLLGQPRFGIDVPCNDSLDPNRDWAHTNQIFTSKLLAWSNWSPITWCRGGDTADDVFYVYHLQDSSNESASNQPGGWRHARTWRSSRRDQTPGPWELALQEQAGSLRRTGEFFQFLTICQLEISTILNCCLTVIMECKVKAIANRLIECI